MSVYAKNKQLYKPYETTNLIENIQPRLYFIQNVNVNLSSKIDAPDFLNEEEVKERYIQKLNEILKEKNLLANDETEKLISVSIDIKQKRIFAGEDLKFISPKVVGKYAHSTFQYNSTLNLESVEFAKFSSSEKFSMGKKGSISKIIRDLSGNGKPENELEDIDIFASFIIEMLPK